MSILINPAKNFALPKLIYCLLFFVTGVQISFAQFQGPNSPAAGANEVVTGSNGAWTQLTNAGSSNNAWALSVSLPTNNSYTDRFVATGFGFSLPSNSLIQGITVTVERSINGNTTVTDREIYLVKGGVTQTGTNKAVATPTWPNGTDNIVTYGGAADLWGNTWTYTDVNAANFGVAVAAIRTVPSGPPVEARIDHITVRIDYLTITPVIISEFSAVKNNSSNTVNWLATNEVNVSSYSVERSNGSNSFSSISTIPPSASTASQKRYEVEDATPLTGVNYYRLVSTDRDGKKQYTPVVAVKNSSKNTGGLQLLSNPVKNSIKLVASNGIIFNKPVLVIVKDMNGKNLYNETVLFNSPGQIQEINLSGKNIPSGNYIADCRQGNEKWVLRLVVE